MEAIAASILSSKTAGVYESDLQTALEASRLEAGHQKEDRELDEAIAKSMETFRGEKAARLAEEAATEAARLARLTRMSRRFKSGFSVKPTLGLLTGILPSQSPSNSPPPSADAAGAGAAAGAPKSDDSDDSPAAGAGTGAPPNEKVGTDAGTAANAGAGAGAAVAAAASAAVDASATPKKGTNANDDGGANDGGASSCSYAAQNECSAVGPVVKCGGGEIATRRDASYVIVCRVPCHMWLTRFLPFLVDPFSDRFVA